MEKIKKMGDGVCCPVGEICEEPESEEEKMDKMMAERGIKVDREFVNPMAIPYVPSSHVRELMARANAKEKKLKIVQKKT